MKLGAGSAIFSAKLACSGPEMFFATTSGTVFATRSEMKPATKANTRVNAIKRVLLANNSAPARAIRRMRIRAKMDMICAQLHEHQQRIKIEIHVGRAFKPGATAAMGDTHVDASGSGEKPRK